MSRTGGDPRELRGLWHELHHHARDLADETAAVALALRLVEGGSSEFVPPLPAHGHRGGDLAEEVRALGRRVDRAAAALDAADRWVGRRAVVTAGEYGLAAHGAHGDVQDLRAGWQHVAAGRWTRAQTVGGPVRAWRTDWLAETGREVGRVTGQGANGARVAATVRLAGRGLAVAGVATGAWDTVQGVRYGDTERAVTGALSAAAGAAMLSGFPPAMVAGAVVSLGVLVWTHREGIGEIVRDPVGWAGEAAGTASAVVGDLAGATMEALGELF